MWGGTEYAAHILGSMPTFRRIKIQATVETSSMLLRDDQIPGALAELRDKLAHLDLAVLSVSSAEPPAPPVSQPGADDPWSERGQPVE